MLLAPEDDPNEGVERQVLLHKRSSRACVSGLYYRYWTLVCPDTMKRAMTHVWAHDIFARL